jgi:hypothetical protein
MAQRSSLMTMSMAHAPPPPPPPGPHPCTQLTYKNLEAWYEELQQYARGIPVIVVANKIDVNYEVRAALASAEGAGTRTHRPRHYPCRPWRQPGGQYWTLCL